MRYDRNPTVLRVELSAARRPRLYSVRPDLRAAREHGLRRRPGGVARLGLGRQVDRLGRFRVAVFALNRHATVLLTSALGITRQFELVGASLGVAHGLFFPAFNALAASTVKAEERDRLFAVFTGAFYGGLGIAVLAGGFVAGVAGYRVTFVVSGLVTLAAGVLLVFSPELSRHGNG